MSFDAAAMLASLFAASDKAATDAEHPLQGAVAESPLTPQPESLALSAENHDDANEWYWQHIDDADRRYLCGPRDWPAPCPWCGGHLVHRPACDDLRREWVPEMPFGKHRGQRIDELPRTYVEWVLARGIGADDFRRQLVQWLNSNY